MATSTRRYPPKSALIATFLAFGLALAGCSDSSDTDAKVDTSVLGTQNKATGAPIKIGIIADGKTDSVDNANQLAAAEATAKYANDYLGGLNSHRIEVDTCTTLLTPAGGTKCGLQMVKDKVDAVVVPALGVDHAVHAALSGSGIPYVTVTSADPAILNTPGAFVLVNPIAPVIAQTKLAAKDGIKKAALIVIDVPAATGPIKALATPIYAAAKVDLDLVAISPQVADMTPQIQAAISKGAEQFSITGTTAFEVSAVKALKQLGFKGRVTLSLVGAVSKSELASLPDGFAGVTNITTQTNDPADPDVKLFNAIAAKYASDGSADKGEFGFVAMDALVRALAKVDGVDAKSIAKALSTMPAPIKLPYGSGITFQCGTKAIALIPNACGSQAISAELNKDGEGRGYQPI